MLAYIAKRCNCPIIEEEEKSIESEGESPREGEKWPHTITAINLLTKDQKTILTSTSEI